MAIKSVLSQTISIHEIIVSNDCSTDNTQSVLEVLGKEIPNLNCIHQIVNLGVSRNAKACMEMAKGDFIIRLDSDDILKPDYAEQLANQLILHPLAGYSHAAVQQIDQFGNFKKIRSLARLSGYQDSNMALKDAAKGFKVAANIIMYKTEALRAVNFSPSPINFAEDYYLITSLSSAGFGNVYLDKVLSEYRVWEDRGKTRSKRKHIEISGLNAVIADVLEPAYKIRNWSFKPIAQMRQSLAFQHSDCLAWNIYSESEKKELKKVILELSASRKIKVISFLYQKGFGFIIDSYKYLISSLKTALKGLYASYIKYFSRNLPLTR